MVIHTDSDWIACVSDLLDARTEGWSCPFNMELLNALLYTPILSSVYDGTGIGCGFVSGLCVMASAAVEN